MASKTKSARKPARAGTAKTARKTSSKTTNSKSASSKKAKPGLMARVAATVKNIGARRAKRQAKVMHFLADNMIIGKEAAQQLAKKADARAARRQKAAREANRKAR